MTRHVCFYGTLDREHDHVACMARKPHSGFLFQSENTVASGRTCFDFEPRTAFARKYSSVECYMQMRASSLLQIVSISLIDETNREFAGGKRRINWKFAGRNLHVRDTFLIQKLKSLKSKNVDSRMCNFN